MPVTGWSARMRRRGAFTALACAAGTVIGRRYRAPRRYDTLCPEAATARDYRQTVPAICCSAAVEAATSASR